MENIDFIEGVTFYKGKHYALVSKKQIKEIQCDICNGTGEVSEDETDSDGNVARGTMSRKCLCQLEEDEYDNQE